MGITNSIRALLHLKGLKQGDLLPLFGLANVQSLSNKFRGERWSAADLVKVAEFAGAKLAFVFENGERIIIGGDQVQGGSGLASGQAAPSGKSGAGTSAE